MTAPRVVLVGPMGAGKTTVGRLLAEGWGVSLRDTDQDVEEAEGRSVSDIFVDSGEEYFREREHAAVISALSEHDGVLALGGGAVLDQRTRDALEPHLVVFLRVGLSDAVKRVGLGHGRPLLLGNVRSRVKLLLDERLPVYLSVADVTVETDGRTADEVAAEVRQAVEALMSAPSTLRLEAAEGRGYDVVVGEDLLDRLPPMLGEKVQRMAVIHPIALAGLGQRVASALESAGFQAHTLQIPDGEAAKDVAVAAHCWQVLGELGFTRSDAMVTVGGGATTDMGGFVAATWLRGVRVVHLPTTLLAMVDAAVGGKTGMNTGEGKNLVGAFHEPSGVLCDLTVLSTLPRPELVSGMAEVVKCGFIADPAILSLVERSPSVALTVGSAEMRELVERAIQVKLDVVAGDFKETGGAGGHPGREVLNYGHTLGHAIERAERYQWRHGEAISIGMVFVAALARLTGSLDEATADRHRSVLESVGLPTSYAGATWPELLATMRIDKKSRGDLMRFVVLEGLARPAVLEGPAPELLEAAFAEVSRVDASFRRVDAE